MDDYHVFLSVKILFTILSFFPVFVNMYNLVVNLLNLRRTKGPRFGSLCLRF